MFLCLEPAALLVTEGAQNITESVCMPRNKIPKNHSQSLSHDNVQRCDSETWHS